MQCDILVVGAGPAGSSAALAAVRHGARVMLVDKRTTIGAPVQCAEFIPKPLLSEVDVSPAAVACSITTMKTFFPDGACHETDAPGYVLNRSIFDKDLALKAALAGVEILTNARCVSKRKGKILMVQNYMDFEVDARLIIGADGPRSVIGSLIGQTHTEMIFAAQYEVPMKEPSRSTEVYFSKSYFGGYAWLFPKGLSANVGVGIKYVPAECNTVYELLDHFVASLTGQGRITGKPVSVTAGLIPVGGPLRTVEGNIVLVGDAAGQTHPITGAGIAQAVTCGQMAGAAAARAILNNDMGILSEYEKEWKAQYEQELLRAVNRRRLLEAEWENLDANLKKCWVAFPEYYS